MQLMCVGIYKKNYKYKQHPCKFFDMSMTVLCMMHMLSFIPVVQYASTGVY